MPATLTQLTPAQRDFVVATIGQYRVLADHSWGLVESWVYRIQTGDGRQLIVKATGHGQRHHVRRELAAYKPDSKLAIGDDAPVAALAAEGQAPQLVAGSAELRVLILTALPGELAQGGPGEWAEVVHERAGELLAKFHGQGTRIDAEYQPNLVAKTLQLLERPHQIPADQVSRAQAVLTAFEARQTTLVPTHGDWHPRNWLIDPAAGGAVRAIDFGRFAWRTPHSDLVRLWSRFWPERPRLKAAAVAGYGRDLTTGTDPDWALEVLHQGVATAVWALAVGDAPFEREGLAMVARGLELPYFAR